MKRRSLLLSSAALVAAPAIVRAQAFPSQPIRLIHGYDAGSNPDTIARHLAPSLTEILGVQIVIEPKPGAAERLAATQVARLEARRLRALPDDRRPGRGFGDRPHAVLRSAARLRVHLDRHALSLRLHRRPRLALQDHRGLHRGGQARAGQAHLRHVGRRLDAAHGDGTGGGQDRRQDHPRSLQGRHRRSRTTTWSAAGSTCTSSPSPAPSR